MPDVPERGQQFERTAVGNELDRGGTRALAGGRVGIGIEQGADRDIEYPGDLREPPGADPVHAFLIFLYLLERDAEPAGEVALRHAHDQSMSADRLSDLDVRGIRLPPFSLRCECHATALPLRDDLCSAILDMLLPSPFCCFVDSTASPQAR